MYRCWRFSLATAKKVNQFRRVPVGRLGEKKVSNHLDMTYKEIQECYKKQYGKTVKTCWIADVKNEMGLTNRKAYNRRSNSVMQNHCPEGIIKTRLKKIIRLKTCP